MSLLHTTVALHTCTRCVPQCMPIALAKQIAHLNTFATLSYANHGWCNFTTTAKCVCHEFLRVSYIGTSGFALQLVSVRLLYLLQFVCGMYVHSLLVTDN